MRIAALVAGSLAVLSLADTASAQRGGFRMPEEIVQRVGMFFDDVPGPLTEGDKIADLDTVELVRAAVAAKQPSVLYLVDGKADEETRGNFEFQLAKDPELGIELRCFYCGRIDLAENAELNKRFGAEAPLFVVFDEEGKATDVSMAEYRPSAAKLKKALEKAGSGAVKPSMAAFTKSYGKFVRELGLLLARKTAIEGRLKLAGDDEGKRKKIQKDLEEVDKEEQALLADEEKLLEKTRLPERSKSARRIGERPRGDWGDRNDKNGKGGKNDRGGKDKKKD
ncbi:MAG: hypothetical protein KDE27_19440 [Planctomycetes bacterium]|nr:hypothetical protein [Planctomycetota bacterium]